MTENQLWHLAGLVLLFVFSAFFSGSETALMAIDRLRVKYLVEKKTPGAVQLETMLLRPDRLLGAILIGNNLVNVAASVFAASLLVDLFGERGEVLTIAVLTPLLVLFAEICPKTYAARQAEKMSFLVLRPIAAVMWILSPVVALTTRLGALLTGGGARANTHEPFMSHDEIRTMIAVGGESGVVAEEQHRMLHGIFELSQMQVRDVMIPRTEVVGIDLSSSFAEILELARASRHSRFPVFAGNLDNVVGIIHSKEILRYVDRPADFDLQKVTRAPYFVPESKRIEPLLQSFRRRRVHLAVVVDEYGGVEGIVTLEDVIEEIVGEIQDEYDADEVEVRDLGEGCYLIDGSAPLRALNRQFGLEFSEEHATTIAGLLLQTLGRIPAEGDRCYVGSIELVVLKLVDRRIEEIEMHLPSPLSPPG
ncbi:MAG: CNNM domain-containing protein [Desulfuromonadales bacterium]|nr:CNNM domain-containing protein [Desulfuromonadales bacterium]